MSHEPSLSESVPHDPPIETERKPLKPGKWYGIIALLCGAEGLLAILAMFLTLLLVLSGVVTPQGMMWNYWSITLIGLFFINPFCVIAGIVFGIWGRNTEGRCCAYSGIVLSVLYILLMAYVIYSVVTRVPCC